MFVLINVSINQCFYQSMFLSINVSINQCFYQSMFLSINQSLLPGTRDCLLVWSKVYLGVIWYFNPLWKIIFIIIAINKLTLGFPAKVIDWLIETLIDRNIAWKKHWLRETLIDRNIVWYSGLMHWMIAF